MYIVTLSVTQLRDVHGSILCDSIRHVKLPSRPAENMQNSDPTWLGQLMMTS